MKVNPKEQTGRRRDANDRHVARKPHVPMRFLISEPAFLAGAASVLDLGATMARFRFAEDRSTRKRRDAIVGPRQSDFAKIAGDFKVAARQSTRYALRRGGRRGVAPEPGNDSKDTRAPHDAAVS